LVRAQQEAKRLSAMIFLATLLALVLVGALSTKYLWDKREAELDRARDVAGVTAHTLAAHAEQTFRNIDVALSSLNHHLDSPEDEDPRTIHSMLRDLHQRSPMLLGIGRVDREGWIISSAGSASGYPVNVADRAYFVHHRSHSDDQLRIGAPLIVRPQGHWAIPVSKRVDDRQGSFAGVIVALVSPRYFTDLHRSVRADSVAIFLEGGALLSRQPGGEELLAEGSHLPSDAIDALRHIQKVLIEGPSVVDGVQRLVALERVSNRPLVVAVTRDRDKVLEALAHEFGYVVTLAVAAAAMIIAFALFLHGSVRRQRALMVELAGARDAATEAQLAAEHANRAKSEFLAHMSHELRTPLNAIVGFGDIIHTQLFGPNDRGKYAEYGGDIKAAGTHLVGIINNILDLAKVDAGKWELNREPVDLHDLAEDLRSLTAGRAKATGVALSIDLPAHLPWLITDRRTLLQVLVNLTVNGIKFTPRDGAVRVCARHSGDMLSIEVEDTGEGISESDLARILQPFGSGSTHLARKNHDTGLGLSLSMRFAQLLGGDLQIVSELGVGTRMIVNLPLLVETSPAPEAAMWNRTAGLSAAA